MARRIALALVPLVTAALWASPAVAQSPPEGALAIAGADYVGGNGDGTPDPGETLRVTVTLTNQGSAPARDVRATMRSDTEGVRVASATASWPDIAPGESARSSNPFIIEIASSVPRTGKCEGSGPVMIAPQGSPGSAEPGGQSGSEPGSAGSGSEGGSSGEATAVEPAPGETTAPDAQGTPQEAPPPGETGTVAPEPRTPDQSVDSSGDMPAQFELPLDITAGGAPAGTQYLSTIIVCAYSTAMQGGPDQAGGGPEPRPMGPGSTPAPNARGPLAEQETSAKSGGGSPALPIAAAFLVVVGALLVRYRLSK